jgi:hypothetical protein
MIRLYRHRACTGKRLHTARGGVVENRPHQIADGENSDDLPGVDDRQVAEAPVDHENRRVLGRVVGLDRLGPPGHPVADDRFGREAVSDGAQHVALGEDADEAISFEDEGGPDPAVVHAAHRALEGRVCFDREQVSRHDVRDAMHQGSVGGDGRSSK